MSDPLIDEARKAVQHFYAQTARVNAAAAAKLYGVAAEDVPPGELEIREAVRCLMMALPLLPTGTHSQASESLSAAMRCLVLLQKLRARPEKPARKREAVPYYLEKD